MIATALKNLQLDSTAKWLAGALALSFFGCTLAACFTNGLNHDDSWIAVAAKNLATGHGYTSSTVDIVKFDPGVTTGPTLVLPAAALIKVFGNQYWVPSLTCWLATVIGMAGVWFSIRRFYKDTANAGFVFLGTFIVMVAYSCGGGSDWGSRLYFWHRLVGEVVAGLLIYVGLATATLSLVRASPKSLLNASSGLCLAAACLCKAISTFALVGLSFVIAASLINNRGKRLNTLLTACLIGIFYLLPLAGQKAAKWLVLTKDELAKNEEITREFFMATGSGVRPLLDASNKYEYILSNIRPKLDVLQNFFGTNSQLLFLFATLVSIILITGYRGSSQRLPWLFSWALIITAAANCCWWACLGWPWMRHIEPAVFLLGAGVIGLMGARPRHGVYLFLGCMLLVASSERIRDVGQSIPPLLRKEARLVGLLNTRDFIVQSSGAHRRFLQGAGIWVNADLEYLLPGVQNFDDYHVAQNSGAASTDYFYAYSDYGDPAMIEVIKSTSCPSNVVFSSPPFVVAQACKRGALTSIP